MADKLTPQQAMAVRDRGGKLLVSAAAGSGKTKVLVDRLMSYLLDKDAPADLDEFLIITYTKAAASELRGKIADKLSERIAQDPENAHLQKQMQRLFLTKISTVHGFCADVLREYAYKLDIGPDFRVADENESMVLRSAVMEELLDEAYSDQQIGTDFRAFVDTQGLGRDDRLVPEIIGKVYDSAMCHMDPEGWLERCISITDMEEIADASETVWGSAVIDDLFWYLDKQIEAMERCREEAENCFGMEKVVCNLSDTIIQLRSVRACESWDQICQHRHIDYGRLTFPRKVNDPALSEKIKAIRNACKKGLEKRLSSFADSSNQIFGDMDQTVAATRGLIQLVRTFWKKYSAAKKSRRLLDFSDLEHRMLDLLLGRSRTGITAAASEIGSRFREIMVDEYQDSNGVQDAIFEALTRKKQNCFMVGDVKQSIYQFRLADPGIFLEKYMSYVPAQDAALGEGRKVLLSHNFRSGPEVIEAVNDVFTTCMSPKIGGLWYTEAEALREGIPHERLSGSGTEFYALEVGEGAYAEEAEFVADKIRKMLSEGTLIRNGSVMVPVKPEDIAILLRSPGSMGHHFKLALERNGIRCTTGSGLDLLQTEEIAVLRSLLQVIVNPRQDIPLVSVLASPVFAFTADELAMLRSVQKKGPVFEALLKWEHPKGTAFLKTLEILRREAGIVSLTKLLERCIRLTKIDSIFVAMEDGDVRRSNIESFFKLASDFEVGMSKDLLQFLDHLDHMDGRGSVDPSASTDGAVTIMSIHRSKGLEFPVVFLCGLARGFNRESLRAPVLCDQELGIGLSVVDPKNRIRYPSLARRAIELKMMTQSVSEEMRVLYVALTRARDRLIMTYAPKNLESALKDIALRSDADGGALLCAEAGCPGDWIMTTAMGRTEAGALFAIGGKPDRTKVSEIPWLIQIASAPEKEEALPAEHRTDKGVPVELLPQLKAALAFQYPYTAATQSPSKQTATGLKGRQVDQEVAENTQVSRKVSARKIPRSRGASDRGIVYGTIIHKVMQYLHFEKCSSKEEIREQISHMIEKGLLTDVEAEQVRVDEILRFFDTDQGRKLRNGAQCLREYKFSVLVDGHQFSEELRGEKILLQGVVDCAILEDDRITVIDFKTDAVTEDNVIEVAEKYRYQVDAYSDALSKVFEKMVGDRLLYFFRIGRYVKL